MIGEILVWATWPGFLSSYTPGAHYRSVCKLLLAQLCGRGEARLSVPGAETSFGSSMVPDGEPGTGLSLQFGVRPDPHQIDEDDRLKKPLVVEKVGGASLVSGTSPATPESDPVNGQARGAPQALPWVSRWGPLWTVLTPMVQITIFNTDSFAGIFQARFSREAGPLGFAVHLSRGRRRGVCLQRDPPAGNNGNQGITPILSNG
jgi:hypothetical protein